MNRRELVAALSASLGYSFMGASRLTASEDKPTGLSLIRLIANPSSFDGRRLGLTGYLANNGLDRALGLYVSEVDARNFIVSNSVDVRIEESAVKGLVGKYITLAGTYHAPPEGVSAYNGYLEHISNIRGWEFGDNR
ncbi:MAG TPA: hypothetical protein VFA76_00360 [Terriglobales bacterium]|nr:hypothetical protein [Terriglobales bacterium]